MQIIKQPFWNKGDKIKFAEEKQRYTIRACNERFAICTKPFNCKKTTLYTIVDLLENVRGRENLIFAAGAETDQECRRMLVRLKKGKTEVSHRHRCDLNIQEIQSCK